MTVDDNWIVTHQPTQGTWMPTAGMTRLDSRYMDFDLSEEQRLLKDSVDGLLNDSYDFDTAQEIRGGEGRLEPERLEQARRAGPARPAVLGRRWRLRRRCGRNHDRDGGARQARWCWSLISPTVVIVGRLPAPRRLGRAEGGAHSLHHRRQQDACLRAAGEELALRPQRCRRPPPRKRAPAGSSTVRNSSCSTATAPTR